MRYFDQMSFGEMASATGQTEDAARHRVNRALEKMRRMLASPGSATLPAAALAALLSENAIKSAAVHAASLPEPLSVHSRSDSSSASLHQITQGVLKAMLLKQAALTAAAVVAVGIPVTIGVHYARAQESIGKEATGVALATPQPALASVPAGATAAAGKFKVIHAFSGPDGATPRDIPILGPDGNYYGMTQQGGAADEGTIYRLTPTGRLTTIYSFTGHADQGTPGGTLVVGKDGNFYGTADGNRAPGSTGIVLKLTPAGSFTVVSPFPGISGSSTIYFHRGSDGRLYQVASARNAEVSLRFNASTLLKAAYGEVQSIPGAAIPYASAYVCSANAGRSGQGGIEENGKLAYSFSGLDGKYLGTFLNKSGNGSFYGVNSSGGAYDKGTLFKRTPAAQLHTALATPGSRIVRITAIHVTGNTVEPTAKILASAPFKIGQKLSADAAANLLAAGTQKIDAVYEFDGYREAVGENLALDPKSGVVTIPIIEGRITTITFSGSHVSIPNAQMVQALAATGIAVGGVYNDNNLRKGLTGINRLPGIESVGPVDVQAPDRNQVTLDIPVRDTQSGGAVTRPVALINSSPSQASPALPRQMTITLQLVGTTPAERSQAAKIAGAPGESAAYTAALLRAGAVTREAPVVTDTDGVSASLNSSPSLLDISMSHPAMSQKITLKPTINFNGTITLACSVALDASSVPDASKLGKTSRLENTSIIQDGTKRLIGSIANPTAKGEIWYVFATARILPS